MGFGLTFRQKWFLFIALSALLPASGWIIFARHKGKKNWPETRHYATIACNVSSAAVIIHCFIFAELMNQKGLQMWNSYKI